MTNAASFDDALRELLQIAETCHANWNVLGDYAFREQERGEGLDTGERQDRDGRKELAEQLNDEFGDRLRAMNEQHPSLWRAWLAQGIAVFEAVMAHHGSIPVPRLTAHDQQFDSYLCESLVTAWSDLKNGTTKSRHAVEWSLAVGSQKLQLYEPYVTTP